MFTARYSLEERLIIEVEGHRILYDKSDPNHKIKGKIEGAWKEIGFVMEENVDFLKKKWKNLRDMFRAKYREQMMQVNGAKGGKKKEWIFFKKLLFLVPYIEITGTMSNYPESPTTPVSKYSASLSSQSEQFIENRENSIDFDMQIISETVDVSKEFTIPASQTRREEKKMRDPVSRKILKTLDSMEKETCAREEQQSPIRQFFNSLATKAETLSDYDQFVLESSCLNIYSQLKFPEMNKE